MYRIVILQVGKPYDIWFNKPNKVVFGGKHADTASSIFLHEII